MSCQRFLQIEFKGMSKDLLANLAVVLAATMSYASAAGWLAARGRHLPRWVFPLSMAATTLLTMMMTFELAPGVLLDLRNPVIVIASIFGGVPAAVLTAATAILYRVYLGGALWLGVPTIAAAAMVGLAAYRWRRATGPGITTYVLAATGVAITSIGASIVASLSIGTPVDPLWLGSHVVLHGVTVLVLGLILGAEEDRIRLSLANSQYRAMVDALPDCLNIKDSEGRFLAANPATAALMGVAHPSDLIGKTDADFYPADLAEIYLRDDQEAVGRRQPTIVEQPGRDREGRGVWLSTLKAPAYDEAGRFVGLITSNRDITAKKTLQSELARMQAYFEQALLQMSDGLAIFDENSILQFSNAPYRALFPKTGHLRVPGAQFLDIVRESVMSGEEVVAEGVTLEQHCAARRAALYRDGDYRMTMRGERTYEARTRVMMNGHVLRLIADITDRVAHESRLEHLALHDPLTSLPNRAYLEQEFKTRLSEAGNDLVLMLIDLDHFKQVNDSNGHLAGDALLVEVAKRMKSVLRHGDFVARIGGDEFAVLLSDSEPASRNADIANRLIKNIRRPMSYNGEALQPGATIGIARANGADDTLPDVVKRADGALYAAKQAGRGTWNMEGKKGSPRVDGTTRGKRFG